jgi:hypothetical protein
MMAGLVVASAQTVPKFLLPRLSWVSTSTQQHTIRAISSLAANYTNTSKTTDDAFRKNLIQKRHNVVLRPKCSILQDPSHRRVFHATARQSRDHHFDTLKFVQRLEDEGFTEAQAVAMMKVLSDVIEER